MRIFLVGFTITILVISFAYSSVLYPRHYINKNLAGPHDSLLIDIAGNRYPVKLFPDNKLWMTVNLKLNLAGSYCYDSVQIHCNQYGKLYTWEAARAGCRQLGPGWKLPSMNEWQELISHFIGVPADSIENRKAAYKALLSGGNTQFNALLGGGRDPDGTFKRLEAHGFYWTATENNKENAWYYNFGKGSQSLYLQMEGEKTRAFSVRCVK